MSDTEVMKSPGWAQEMSAQEKSESQPKMTDSQIIKFKDVPESVRKEPSQSSGQAPISIIGESLHFNGELSADEDLLIEGTVEGKINQGKCCLTLKPNGKIIATVHATKIFIEGTVKGDLHATVSVTVRESARIDGNIISPRVAIDDGARFNGQIDMRSPADKPKKKK